MEEQDPIPTARLHWTRLVLGRGHPFIIIVALALVGVAICWFSLQKIASLTKTPTRYTMDLLVATQGCDDHRLRLRGDIGSSGPSFLEIWQIDDESRPLVGRGCRLRSIRLTSNLPLEPHRPPDESSQLIVLSGAGSGVLSDRARE